MAKASVPHFKNDVGVSQISIGVKKFMCEGASPPFDHPHVYLDMRADGEKICPYCSTLYKHDSKLGADQSTPEGCIVDVQIA